MLFLLLLWHFPHHFDCQQTLDLGSTAANSTSINKKIPRRPEETLPQMRYEWGSLDIDTFIQKLREDEGIAEAKVEQNSNGYIIHLVSANMKIMKRCDQRVLLAFVLCIYLFQPKEDALIQVEDRSTHMYCDPELRQRLRKVLLQCLNRI